MWNRAKREYLDLDVDDDDSDDDDDTPPHRSGPGYGGAPVDLVEEVADAIGKTADEVTGDDIDAYIEDEPWGLDPEVCDECGDRPWVDYCPACHRSDD